MMNKLILVKNLKAAENLALSNTIIADKSIIITQNNFKVQNLYILETYIKENDTILSILFEEY